MRKLYAERIEYNSSILLTKLSNHFTCYVSAISKDIEVMVELIICFILAMSTF